jgi:hypothetical protein
MVRKMEGGRRETGGRNHSPSTTALISATLFTPPAPQYRAKAPRHKHAAAADPAVLFGGAKGGFRGGEDSGPMASP